MRGIFHISSLSGFKLAATIRECVLLALTFPLLVAGQTTPLSPSYSLVDTLIGGSGEGMTSPTAQLPFPIDPRREQETPSSANSDEGRAISAKGKGIYVQSVTFNGRKHDSTWLPLSELKAKRNSMVFITAEQPNKSWGSRVENAPPSFDVEQAKGGTQ